MSENFPRLGLWPGNDQVDVAGTFTGADCAFHAGGVRTGIMPIAEEIARIILAHGTTSTARAHAGTKMPVKRRVT